MVNYFNLNSTVITKSIFLHPELLIELQVSRRSMIDISPFQISLHNISNRTFFVLYRLPFLPLLFILILPAQFAQRKVNHENFELASDWILSYNEVPRFNILIADTSITNAIDDANGIITDVLPHISWCTLRKLG